MNFVEIKNFCVKNLKEKERWPSYYERRYHEFLTLIDLLPKKKYLKVLELGCGMGYYSAFLANIANEVVATDLEEINLSKNSMGLQTTRDYLSLLNIKNITVISASAEELPFNDNSFDLVFSSHVLEHVPDVNKAIKEINRVLKPGGINFCVVPTSTDKVYAFFLFYIYILKRIVIKTADLIFRKRKNKSSAGTITLERDVTKKNYLSYFPFPPPHGAYPGYMSELKNWSLQKWKQTITQQNKINLINQYSLQLNPLLPLLGSVFPNAAVKIYSKTRKFEMRFSQSSLIKYLGISTLLITEKEK